MSRIGLLILKKIYIIRKHPSRSFDFCSQPLSDIPISLSVLPTLSIFTMTDLPGSTESEGLDPDPPIRFNSGLSNPTFIFELGIVICDAIVVFLCIKVSKTFEHDKEPVNHLVVKEAIDHGEAPTTKQSG
ncbi:hypothetical protein RchiOBHm_Chr3g0464461 [Rosa chinensis]|uniref:Uncharacterized protein n=1 Tax=Rosa chinensis TaxID=74649 RepID=A0A2P6R9F8_ROSCH|nr:hypothetical protein RchiOBHm_Chr3g0464461 [Rosa chinensis]